MTKLESCLFAFTQFSALSSDRTETLVSSPPTGRVAVGCWLLEVSSLHYREFFSSPPLAQEGLLDFL